MARERRPRSRSEQAFTLLELLMVVIIIAILATLAIPQYTKSVAKARRSEALSALGVMRSAQLRYQAEHGSFTDDFGLLDVDFGGISGAAAPYVQGSWTYTLGLFDPIALADGLVGTTVQNCQEGMTAGGVVAPDSVQPDASGIPC